MSDLRHIPVLQDAVLNLLQPATAQSLVDTTIGMGGHAAALMERAPADARLLGIDRDVSALHSAGERLRPLAERVTLRQGNFADLSAWVGTEAELPADVLLADLGVSSPQFDDPARGFSFREAGPLDMRMDASAGQPLNALLAGVTEKDLADVLWQYGEERYSRRIARVVCERFRAGGITDTAELATAVVHGLPAKARHLGHIHGATRSFQALRIWVNGELAALETLLASLPRLLRPGGRAAIMSFHSLEDRLVKQAFNRLAQELGWQRLTRKPITADETEVARNPRARSAKLRGIQKSEPRT